MARKSKRRRLNRSTEKGPRKELNDIFKGPPLAPATEEEKRAWRGWCELESEPVRSRTAPISRMDPDGDTRLSSM